MFSTVVIINSLRRHGLLKHTRRAVTHVDEPGAGYLEDTRACFGLWVAGKNFAICAWNSKLTPYFQAVGDPLVKR